MEMTVTVPEAPPARVFRERALDAEFHENGYVVTDWLSPAEVSHLLDVWRQAPKPAGRLAFSSSVFSTDLGHRLAMHRSISAVFQPHLDRLLYNYRLALSGFVCKQPGHEASVVELHQDPSLVMEPDHIGLGIWCPLMDVDARNGCLRIVRGSHRINNRPREAVSIDFAYPELLPLLEERYLTEEPMRAGQAFIYPQALFHSSPPNLSDEERVVAGALAVPSDGDVTIFMRDEQRHPGELAAYRLDDEGYRTYILGSRPAESLCIGYVPDQPEPIDDEALHSRLRSLHEHRSV
jgi:hypothetical protein